MPVAAEQEVASQRRKNIQHEEQLYQEVLGTSNELEAAQRGIAEAEKRFHEEEAVLRSIADSTRKQLASEAATDHFLRGASGRLALRLGRCFC